MKASRLLIAAGVAALLPLERDCAKSYFSSG